MAGGVPLTPQSAQALIRGTAQASPPPNPQTPNTRITPNDKFLERMRSIKALLKMIDDDSPPEDGRLSSVLDIFRNSINQMLLNAPADTVMQDLQQRIGSVGLTPPMAGGLAPTPPMPMGGPASLGQQPAQGGPVSALGPA